MNETFVPLAPRRMQPVLFHDLCTPEDVIGVRGEVRSFAEREVAPLAWDIGHQEESREAFPRSLFGKMAEAGLFRVLFSRDEGGCGLRHPMAAAATVMEELAYYSNSVAAIYDVHCVLVGGALMHASPELRERYLPPLLNGEKIGSFATTEPDASSDLSVEKMVTVARRKGDRYYVSGHKRYVSNAPVADFVVTLCADGARMSTLVIDLHARGVSVGEPDKKLGNHGQLTADVRFDDVEVPVCQVIGAPGDGLKIALQTLTGGRIAVAASGAGMAQAVFDHSVEHLRRREAFGRKIAQFQHWQFKLAERATQIEHARNLYLKAALRMDQGEPFPEPEAAMAKYYATDLAAGFARDGVQIFGGYGFMREVADDRSRYRVEEVYRDSKVAEIYEGTNELQKWIIARAIFGKELVG